MGDRFEHDLGNLKDQIAQIVSKVSRIDASELQDHVRIREELGIDSLSSMEILARCEKALGIRIDESLFADVETVGDFYALITRIAGQKGG